MSFLKRVFSFKVSPNTNEQATKLRLADKSRQLFEQVRSTMAGGKKNKSKGKPGKSGTQAASSAAKKTGLNKTQLNAITSNANEFYKFRTEFVRKLKQNGENPYPHKFEVTISVNQFIDDFAHLESETTEEDKLFSVAGRVVSKRELGDKLVFYDLIGEGSKLQLFADQSVSADPDAFERTHSAIKRGDIVGCTGYPGKTKSGELSLYLKEIKLLAPTLRVLPRQHHGLEEKEIKYRMRYLDLILNKQSRANFVTRSNVIRFMRAYLDQLGFLEVETPMMNIIAGCGANARPFKTHHNELRMDLWMRVAPELHLKMLVVGGFDRVYELGKQFRNEGIDRNHNPEFTMLEFYLAYADYNDLMSMVENLLVTMFNALLDKQELVFQNEEQESRVKLLPPFQRIDFMESLEKELNCKLPPAKDLDKPESNQLLIDLCRKHQIKIEGTKTTQRCLDKLVSQLVEPKLISPTFIVNYPELMSPLAKQHRTLPGLTERFELFINGSEIANGYTELNDPQIQRQRFEANKDPSAQLTDEMFCLSLEYGLPPTGGVGIGVDRLTKLITGCHSLREIILFPTLRPDNKEQLNEFLESVE